ncbi:phage tail tape measure protein [Pseudofrankia sp. BMG5.37]|uniref:phage tail tape measure protein n=1 Tax=Pseudofrankia sp. BMG5.37 TaxID=3050035 RepID=UPI002893C46A|nr:phage tail tape measure protein [Pseudofrankia sp. BMG5.37]MDT3438344.1 phage tail tape measure protein [Pseudofrankia sp. BMG5.37]
MAVNVLGSAYVRIVPQMDAGWARLGDQVARGLGPAVDAALRLQVNIDAVGTAARRAAGDVDRIGDAARGGGEGAGELERRLAAAEEAARQAGDEAEELRRQLASAGGGDVADLARRLGEAEEATRRAAAEAEDLRRRLDDAGEAGRRGADETARGWRGALDGIGSGVKVASAAIGAATGAALAAGVQSSLSAGGDNAKLAAQLGLDPTAAASAGKIAGSIYSNNWGDSLGTVNTAIRGVYTNIGEGNATWLKDTSQKAVAIGDIFETDVGGVTASVGQLIKTGLVDNADQAFDVITRGFQSGVDKSGDFLDTLNEYSVQWSKFGLDAKTATGLLSQGLQAGARDSDLVADAIKEFSIRAIDGSTTTAAGFKAIGLDAGAMAAEIGKGGTAATGALDLTLDRLRGIKDPVAQAAAATALFGTQAEDLGAALFALDPSEAVSALGQVEGATTDAMATISASPASALETFKRNFQMKLTEVGGIIVKWATAHQSFVQPLLIGLGALAAVIVTVRIAMAAWTAAQVAWRVATTIATGVQWAFNAAMSANPIGLIIIGVLALVAGIVLLYRNSETARAIIQGAFNGIKVAAMVVYDFFTGHWGQVGAVLSWPFVQAWGLIQSGFSLVTGAASAVIGWVRSNWPLLLGILTGPIGLAVVMIVKHWSDIQAAGVAVLNWIISLPGMIVSTLASVGQFLAAPFVFGFQLVSGWVETGVGWFLALPGRVGSAIVSIAQVLLAPYVIGFNLVSGAVTTAVGWFVALPGRVGSALASIGSTLASPFVTGWSAVSGGITTAVGWFVGIPGRLGTALVGVAGAIVGPFKSAFNSIASLWNRSIGKIGVSIPSWVPGIGGNSFSVPDIPLLAHGGLITSAGWTVVGDAGPELMWQGRGAAVAPLPPSLDLSASRSRALAAAGAGGRGAATINLHQEVDARGATDPAAIEAAVRRANNEMLADLARLLDSGVEAY